MKKIKQEAKDMIERMPDDITWDDIIHEFYVKNKIETVLDVIDEG